MAMPSSRYPIEVVPYDPAWLEIAARESKRLREALGDALVVVHHIGSTSVPHLRAKPIVDLMPLVTSLYALDARREAVEALGWSWGGEMGIAGRRYGVLVDTATGRRVAQMHAFTEAWPDVARHLHFRDYLRAHDDEARAYEGVKLRARELHPDDVLAYNGAKAEWIRACEKRAGEWAKK
jgi:GrpB-like predicted nucleotidyltransferase (UPF0157 family)